MCVNTALADRAVRAARRNLRRNAVEASGGERAGSHAGRRAGAEGAAEGVIGRDDLGRRSDLEPLTVFRTAAVGVISFYRAETRSLTNGRTVLGHLLDQFNFRLARQPAFETDFEEQQTENALLHREKCVQREPKETRNGGRLADRKW